MEKRNVFSAYWYLVAMEIILKVCDIWYIHDLVWFYHDLNDTYHLLTVKYFYLTEGSLP